MKAHLLMSLAAIALLPWAATNAGHAAPAFPRLEGPYLGQELPGDRPEVFAAKLSIAGYPGAGYVFTRGGTEAYYFSVGKGESHLMCSESKDGVWQPPRRATRVAACSEVHPFLSPDGRVLFFGTNRRISAKHAVPYFNLWSMPRTPEGLGEAEPLPPVINTGYENCGTMSRDGIFYFRRVSAGRRGDILASRFANGAFQPPVALPGEINTEFDESHPAIAPDGSYMIFSSKRPGGFNHGRDELWVSFRTAGGGWTEAANLGAGVNDGSSTSCATISPDGSVIFFVRIRAGAGTNYWVSAKFLEPLRPGSRR